MSKKIESMKKTTKVAVIQASPIFFDLQATLKKTEQLVKKYAAQSCQLILFPETFIPGYPRGMSFGAVVGKRTPEGRKLWKTYWDNSVNLNGAAGKSLSNMAKENEVFLAIGITERDFISGTLYCSLAYYAPSGELVGVHRKIKPTGVERLIWGESDGKDLVTFDTKIGKLGGLICWENLMPLARMSMYQKGVEIYLAPTADGRDTWTAMMQHIACEGRCFVLGCNQFSQKTDYPKKYHEFIKEEPEIMSRGGSIIVSPLGEIIAGPLFDEEGALVADLNLEEIIESKLDFDVIGHYSRPDIFKLEIEGQPAIKKI